MHYHTVVADPGWTYDNALTMGDGVARSASSQYETMSVERIKGFLDTTTGIALRFPEPAPKGLIKVGNPILTLRQMIAADAHLWLWVTNPFLLDGTGTAVCRAWGFEPKTLITWTKGRLNWTMVDPEDGGEFETVPFVTEHVGMGRYTRGVTEHLILATRGKATKLVQAHNITNWFLAPRAKHSEKPDEAYARIERVSTGPYLDIFARKFRPGWDAIGDQLPSAA